MSQAARKAVIEEYLKALRLTAVSRELEACVRRAQDGAWAYEDFLKELLEAEILSRNAKAAARRVKEAHFPDIKTLEQIDWEALQGISRAKIAELATCGYLEKGQDVILAGPIGTGKTHLSIALGIEAAKRRFKVVFTRAADLVRSLVEARDERVLGRLHKRFSRVHLLIIDELGFVPFDRVGGELIFNLLSERYERRSTIITTNLSFSEWVQVFGNEKLTTALLDRLGHHSYILTTKGPSFRTSKKGKKEKLEECRSSAAADQ